MSPVRIQRRRVKGWRQPLTAVYVGRPSRWGNPFTIARTFERDWIVTDADGDLPSKLFPTEAAARAHAVELHRLHTGPMGNYEIDVEQLRRDLAGLDLVCWCPLDGPCHADVLLEIANGGAA